MTDSLCRKLKLADWFIPCAYAITDVFRLTKGDGSKRPTKNGRRCHAVALKGFISMHFHSYEDESISNLPIPFPIPDGHNCSCLVSMHVLYVGTKLHAYRVIL